MLLFPELRFFSPKLAQLRRQHNSGRQRPLFYHPNQERYTQSKLRQTPAWADRKAMLAVYDTARALTISTGVWHVVDHIVPLNSEIVSGLHCHHNLRAVPWKENAVKGNRWWPDMPSNQLELNLW